MNKSVLWLTIAGLVIDIIGAWCLFTTRTKDIPVDEAWPTDGSYSIGTDVLELINHIRETNRINLLRQRIANRWFILIVIGSLFQLIATIISLYQTS